MFYIIMVIIFGMFPFGYISPSRPPSSMQQKNPRGKSLGLQHWPQFDTDAPSPRDFLLYGAQLSPIAPHVLLTSPLPWAVDAYHAQGGAPRGGPTRPFCRRPFRERTTNILKTDMFDGTPATEGKKRNKKKERSTIAGKVRRFAESCGKLQELCEKCGMQKLPKNCGCQF